MSKVRLLELNIMLVSFLFDIFKFCFEKGYVDEFIDF